MDAITNNAHMQAVSDKAQACQLNEIFSRHGRKKLTQCDTHHDQGTRWHDQITRKQKSTWRQGVKQILLHAEVGAPNQDQHERGHQGQVVLLLGVQGESKTVTGTRAAKAHINS